MSPFDIAAAVAVAGGRGCCIESVISERPDRTTINGGLVSSELDKNLRLGMLPGALPASRVAQHTHTGFKKHVIFVPTEKRSLIWMLNEHLRCQVSSNGPCLVQSSLLPYKLTTSCIVVLGAMSLWPVFSRPILLPSSQGSSCPSSCKKSVNCHTSVGHEPPL